MQIALLKGIIAHMDSKINRIKEYKTLPIIIPFIEINISICFNISI